MVSLFFSNETTFRKYFIKILRTEKTKEKCHATKLENESLKHEQNCLEEEGEKKNKTNMLALGRRISEHDDGAINGQVKVEASNLVVAFELFTCELALLQLADIDEDGFDPNDVVEFDTFAVFALITCSPELH